jgi:polyisoprenoid-binding protein YceI
MLVGERRYEMSSSTETRTARAASPILAPQATEATTWDIDASHTSAGFKVRHLMVSHVRGRLGAVSGTVVLDEQDPAGSRVDVSIDVAAIDTRDEKRDAHLRSADFFDVANHPNVTFRSTAVRPGREGAGSYDVTGDLTIRGVTRPVTLAVEPLAAAVADPWGSTRRGATARARVNRKDFGLQWNLALETGGFVVGDDVAIEIEVELIRRKG